MKKDDRWFSADNRRLWVFRQLERLGKCATIAVQETLSIPSKKFTTNNNGESIEVRGDPGGMWHRNGQNDGANASVSSSIQRYSGFHGRCYICREWGHRAADCDESDDGYGDFDGECYDCGEWGHRAAQCQN